MTILTSVTTHLLETERMPTEALTKHAAAARRSATAIRRQLATVSPCLSAKESETLSKAATILDGIADAADAARQQQGIAEQATKRRTSLAREAVELAFADVTDAAGVVVLLVTGGSWRGRITDDPQNGITETEGGLQLDPFDAREIMHAERHEALDYYARRLADAPGFEPKAAALGLRARFDTLRPETEQKYSRLIRALSTSLQDVRSAS